MENKKTTTTKQQNIKIQHETKDETKKNIKLNKMTVVAFIHF